jgi:mono/diheme cytochrome c family protein|tara:strand:- start:448 stop:2022 length:1575 start_codon:yes stop_codon:yes gene_type:complete
MIRRTFLTAALAGLLATNLLAADAGLITKGRELFQTKICTTCHQVPGGPPALAGVAMKAPKFEGNFWGTERVVTLGFGGKDAKVKFDEAYFVESVRKPIDKVVKSAAAPMPPPPAVNDEEMNALLAYVKSLSDGTAAPAAGGIVAKGALKKFRYRVYNGSWGKLPDFEKLKPVKTGEAASGIADTNFSKKRDNFGLVIEGELEIKEKGRYTFNLGSDDGSRLLVNGKPVVVNDGVHGVVNKSGSANLNAGVALVRIEFFEKGGGEHLSLNMSGPGIKKLQLARNTAPQGRGKKPAIATGNPIIPENNEAVMYRNFIQGASPRGIGVGYPEKLNICFDANAINIVMTWHGAFMDGAKHWNGRGQGFQPPLGHYLVSVKRAQAIAQLPDAKAPWPELKAGNNDDDRAKGLRFRGYKLVESQRPVFRYSAGETMIEDYVIPQGGPLPSYTRQITFSGSGKYYYLAGADSSIEKVGGNSWKIGKTLKVTLDASAEPILRDGPDGKELLVPVDVKGKADIRARYEWDLN